MKILGMGVPELLIILVVILLIFGPKNLPKLGSALGKTVKNLREGMAPARRTSRKPPTTRKLSKWWKSRGRACSRPEEDGEEGRQEEGRVTSLLRQHQARTVVRPLRCAGAPPMYKRENRNHYG